MKDALKPDVRLAWFGIPAVNAALDAPSPTVRLARKQAQGDGILTGRGYGGVDMSDKKLSESKAPALLVSYYYLEPFLKSRADYVYRDWSMDSGAFSAHNSGAKIDLNRYVDKCLELLASDPKLTEVFALDAIGDADKSHSNTQEMWRQGVPAMPVFHAGEPEDLLYQYAKDYPKVAIGGMVATSGIRSSDEKFSFLEQCFARIWPKKVHGLGVASERMVYGLPFHSTDATNWEIGPCAFGNWQKFGAMSVRGSNQDLRSQVFHYLEMESKARVRWAKEMALLETLPGARPSCYAPPAVRLAVQSGNGHVGADGKVVDRIARAINPTSRPKPAAGVSNMEMDGKWTKNWWE